MDSPKETPALAGVVHRNIQALLEVQEKYEEARSTEERAADRITTFAGTMRFVYLHAALFGGWIILNLGLIPGIKPFDPFPFVMLAMWASVEAIFLSTFVLISQNRMMMLSEKRADLDLQVSLLAEHEVTRLIHMVDALSRRLGMPEPTDKEISELKEDVAPEAVLDEIERAAGTRAHDQAV
jgi:uncharacterized membrane protein